MKTIYDGVRHTIELRSGTGKKCQHCDFWVGPDQTHAADLGDQINHYIEYHDYKLLHVGTDTDTDYDGQNYTKHPVAIAIVGK